MAAEILQRVAVLRFRPLSFAFVSSDIFLPFMAAAIFAFVSADIFLPLRARAILCLCSSVSLRGASSCSKMLTTVLLSCWIVPSRKGPRFQSDSGNVVRYPLRGVVDPGCGRVPELVPMRLERRGLG